MLQILRGFWPLNIRSIFTFYEANVGKHTQHFAHIALRQTSSVSYRFLPRHWRRRLTEVLEYLHRRYLLLVCQVVHLSPS